MYPISVRITIELNHLKLAALSMGMIALWLCKNSYGKRPIKIVDSPLKNGDFPVRKSQTASLPEGNYWINGKALFFMGKSW